MRTQNTRRFNEAATGGNPPGTDTGGPLLLDVDAAARALSCSVWSVRQLVQSGALPVAHLPSPANPLRRCRRTLIPRAALLAYVERITEAL